MKRVIPRLLIVAGACGPPFLLSGCVLVKWLTNPQPRVEYSHEQYSDPAAIVGSHPVVYRLRPTTAATVSGSDLALLREHAPILVQGQEAPGDESYERTADQIGSPSLVRLEDGEYRVHVDTKKPLVYTNVRHVDLGGERLKQLIYSYWYPRHPVGGIQEGDVDGGVLRITLDRAQQPAFYEFVFPCGCYHGVYAADQVEAWALLEFMRRDEGKMHYTEKSLDDRINWVVRDIVVGAHQFKRPVVLLGAGDHGLRALQTEALVQGLDSYPEIGYDLASYEDLTRLEVRDEPGVRASMFTAEGLVWGGRRWGEELVFPSIDRPGWPRHLDKIKIHWDEARFADPSLIETYIRVPREVTSPGRSGRLAQRSEEGIPARSGENELQDRGGRYQDAVEDL